MLAALVVAPAALLAQPSGGPYGPVAQTYEVPAGAAHVIYVAPDGVESASGASISEPTTIESAIARVVTGDAIILRGGVYRTGGLVLNQSVTIQPYADEEPVLKGTLVAAKWEQAGDGVWRTSWEHLFPSKPRTWWRQGRAGRQTPLHRFNDDMVFIDSEPLLSAGSVSEIDAHSYYIDYDAGQVYIRNDPKSRLVEITAWNSALVCTPKPAHGREPDHRGPTIRGITFTQYAYRALEVEGKRGSVPSTEEPTDDPVGLADPSTFGKEIVGTTLENCTITHCSRVAGYFRGDHLAIRHCLVSDTSTEGIYVIGSSDCLLEKNIFGRNNVEHLTGYYPAAVKIFNQTRRVTCRDNLFLEQPESNAIWYDVGNVDGVFVDNWIKGVQTGLFFEISRGIVCAGNVFVNCDTGVRILNSADARVVNNTFVNAGVLIDRTERSAVGDHFAWHPRTGPGVDEREGHVLEGNLILADDRYTKPLARIEQSGSLFGKLVDPMVSGMDSNVYVRPESSGHPLIAYGPVPEAPGVARFNSLDAFRAAVSGMELHGVQIDAAPRAVVRSIDLKRYDPIHPIARADGAPVLAGDVRKLLGWSEEQARSVGAYPSRN